MDDIHAHYVDRLEASLGGENFHQVVHELHSDPRVGREDAVHIASKFYGKMPASTSRTKAIAHIRSRHDKLMEFKNQSTSANKAQW